MTVFAERLAAATQYERFDPWYFGIPPLDAVVKGVRPGFINYICARPHVGKTLLAVAGIRNNPEVPTLLISADDDPEIVVRKMMQYDGVIDDGWKATQRQMADYIATNYPNLDIVDGVSWGPVAFNGQISVLDAISDFGERYGRPPELVVYDYLGIDGTDYASMMTVVGWMKDLTKHLPMPVLTIAQSNRQGTRTERGPDGQNQRRGFRMEDLNFGGEQAAGLMIGLSEGWYAIDGRMTRAIEVDVVKNKAVFDGSGLTKSTEPIVLCHSRGRLTDRSTAQYEALQAAQWQQEELTRGVVHEARGDLLRTAGAL